MLTRVTKVTRAEAQENSGALGWKLSDEEAGDVIQRKSTAIEHIFSPFLFFVCVCVFFLL